MFVYVWNLGKKCPYLVLILKGSSVDDDQNQTKQKIVNWQM